MRHSASRRRRAPLRDRPLPSLHRLAFYPESDQGAPRHSSSTRGEHRWTKCLLHQISTQIQSGLDRPRPLLQSALRQRGRHQSGLRSSRQRGQRGLDPSRPVLQPHPRRGRRCDRRGAAGQQGAHQARALEEFHRQHRSQGASSRSLRQRGTDRPRSGAKQHRRRYRLDRGERGRGRLERGRGQGDVPG